MQIVELVPTEVKVKGGLDRYRTDMGDIKGLAESILRTRQILPIVINNQKELIDGGRRLAACLLAGIKVKAVYEDVVDEFEMRELELEANLNSKEYTPAEYALAIKDLHNLKQKRHGESVSGSIEGWSIKQTADLLGKSRGHVYNALESAELVNVFPELLAAKKQSEIRKAGKGLRRVATAMEGLKKHEEQLNESKESFTLHLGDAVEDMENTANSSIDILLTDPLYGIDAGAIVSSIGGRPGGLTTSGYRIEDKKDDFFYYRALAKESFRFTTDQAHGYIFLGPEHFWTVRGIFLEAGWRVHVKPIIWIKRVTGQCNVPSAWPASCYEMCMYIRKDKSRLVKEGQADWLEHPPVDSSKRLHTYEKPVPVLLNLLERVSLPGQNLYDPFMGSGSSIEAGLKLKLFCRGVDNSKEAYANACSRMANLKEEIK